MRAGPSPAASSPAGKPFRMQIQQTDLSGVVILEPRVFADQRGFFQEIYQKERYAATGVAADFVQDNYSRSAKGTLRGLHFQIEHAQGKLVQCLRGEVFDENHRQLYVPPGFAHGFYVLSDMAEMFYKCDDYYFPQHERSLLWNDPAVGIEWPLADEPILSEKDRNGTPLSKIES